MTLLVCHVLLDCDQADRRVFWHNEISEDKTHQLYCWVEPEGPGEPKPGDKVGEELGESCSEDHGGEEDERGPRTSNLGGEYLTDDYLKNIQDKKYYYFLSLFLLIISYHNLYDRTEPKLSASKNNDDESERNPVEVLKVVLYN